MVYNSITLEERYSRARIIAKTNRLEQVNDLFEKKRRYPAMLAADHYTESEKACLG